MNDDDPDLEALKEASNPGTRTGAQSTAPQNEFVEEIKAAIAEKNQPKVSKSVAVWDGNLAGLLEALDNDETRMEETVETLAGELDREVDGTADKSEVLRLLLLLGLAEGLPELHEQWRDAVGELAKEQL